MVAMVRRMLTVSEADNSQETHNNVEDEDASVGRHCDERVRITTVEMERGRGG